MPQLRSTNQVRRSSWYGFFSVKIKSVTDAIDRLDRRADEIKRQIGNTPNPFAEKELSSLAVKRKDLVKQRLTALSNKPK